jgi:hypothetical protein
LTTSQSLKIEGQKYYYHRYLKFSTGFKVGVKTKTNRTFCKATPFNNSSVKKTKPGTETNKCARRAPALAMYRTVWTALPSQ